MRFVVLSVKGERDDVCVDCKKGSTSSLWLHEPLYIALRYLQRSSASDSTRKNVGVVTHLERHYDKVSIQTGRERLTNGAGRGN
jgi:hypothetical protein